MPWWPLRSLRSKLQVFALLLIVAPGLLLTVIAYASARRGLERTAARQLTEVAHDALNEVVEAIAAAQQDLRSWAGQDVMRDVIVGDIDKRIARQLDAAIAGGAPFLSLVCLDRAGRVVATGGRGAPGPAPAGDAVRVALAGGEYQGDPPPWGPGGRRGLVLATPIRDPDHPADVAGALVARYDVEHAVGLTDRIRRSLLAHGLDLDLLLLDGAGTVFGEVWRDGVPPGVAETVRRAATAMLRGSGADGRRGWQTLRSADALAGWERSDAAQGGWAAVAVEPLAEALAPVAAMRRRLAAALAVVLAGSLALASWWAGRLTRPLRDLTRATREIARVGHPPAPVAVSSRDEIGTLASSFNAMAGELARAQEDLMVAAKFAFIGEVAAGIAHEVRTPLGIMRGSAQMLARSVPADRPECGELADMIVGEVDRLERVVAGLLELARPRLASVEPTALAPVLGRALDFLEARGREKGIVLERMLDVALPPARCDGEQIYQVALNLILNALQILPAGGHVRVRTVHAPDGRVGFEVEDDGPGIPPELHERVFAPFFSLRDGGTGLGLALVERMVRAQQGTVGVQSEPGRGATFRVELPAAAEEA